MRVLLTGVAYGLPLVIAFVVVLAPWTWRNYKVHGRFMPMTSLGGASLLIAIRPDYQDHPWQALQRITPAGLTEAEMGSLYQKLAQDYIRQHPGAVFADAPEKFIQFWHIGYHGGGPSEIAFLIVYLPIVLSSLIALVIVLRRQAALTLLMVSMPLMLSILHSVFLPEGRYRAPAMPFVIILAGYGFAWALTTAREQVSRYRRKETGRGWLA
jgi:hypothetical protein